MRTAIAARDQVLAVVSHDLRNPLSAITMCASALQATLPPDAAGAGLLLATIRESTDWMHRIIQDLLNVASAIGNAEHRPVGLAATGARRNHIIRPCHHHRSAKTAVMEIETILTRNHVGRIAYVLNERVDIEPINYVYADGWIYCRTSPGTKVAAIQQRRRVAFEVDESDGVFHWRSVVVHGQVDFLRPDSPLPEQHSFVHGLELLGELVPGTRKWNDPVPFRHVVFRIHLDEVTGREAMPERAPSRRSATRPPSDMIVGRSLQRTREPSVCSGTQLTQQIRRGV